MHYAVTISLHDFLNGSKYCMAVQAEILANTPNVGSLPSSSILSATLPIIPSANSGTKCFTIKSGLRALALKVCSSTSSYSHCLRAFSACKIPALLNANLSDFLPNCSWTLAAALQMDSSSVTLSGRTHMRSLSASSSSSRMTLV